MRGEIITIGDELLTGRVCDINSFFLSGRISSYGLKVEAMTSVGDNPEHIIEVLARAVERSEFVLVSGGLGPTEDDLTTQVAADFFGRPLVFKEDFFQAIKKSLTGRGVPWVETFRKLAYLPEGAERIDPHGQCCGFYLKAERGDRTVPVFFLPGVPHELRQLAEQKVLPLLIRYDREQIVVRQRLFKLFGVQEAYINEALKGVQTGEEGVRIGFYPNFPENHVTVTVRSYSTSTAEAVLARIEEEVNKRLGAYVVAIDNGSLEASIGRLLRQKGLAVAVAESCTGGLISHRLTSVSGSSDYFKQGIVAYSNQAKQELLKVPADIIDRFGAVSAETAGRMARGVMDSDGVDIGLASTGIAGPSGGSKDKPVGTVYIALNSSTGSGVERFQFTGTRERITILTAQTALSWLYRYLIDDSFLFRHRPA